MLTWRGTADVPPGWGRCVLTIGVFDGVHRGHQLLVGRAVERARELGVPCVVLTFDPHPSEVLRPGSHPALLTSAAVKAQRLAALGVDVVCTLPFTLELSALTAEQFAQQVLVDGLHAQVVLVGSNFRYGNRAAGDGQTLAEAGARLGFEVEVAALHGSGERTWSSTYIRERVEAGDMAAASEALGREHRVDGVVVTGDQRGRELGYPTANLDPVRWSAIPADGVYAGRLLLDESPLTAAISIGTNPTFHGTQRRVEAFVLDFSGDLYGRQVGLTFTAQLRETLAFDGVEQLVEQMGRDVQRTRELVDPIG